MLRQTGREEYHCPGERVGYGLSVTHQRKEVKQFLLQHPKVHRKYFPGYAPGLNSAEYVWNQTDHTLSNSESESLKDPKKMLRNSTRKLRGSEKLHWSFICASDPPWTR